VLYNCNFRIKTSAYTTQEKSLSIMNRSSAKPWHVIRHRDDKFLLYAAINPEYPDQREFVLAHISSLQVAHATQTVLNQLWEALLKCKNLSGEHRTEEAQEITQQRFMFMDRALTVALANARRVTPFISRISSPLLQKTFTFLVQQAQTCHQLIKEYQQITHEHRTFVGLRRIYDQAKDVPEYLRELYRSQTMIKH